MASVNELPWCSATQLLHHYATGTLSPVDVMKTIIALIERSEPHLSATYAFTPEQALAAAHHAEQRWQHATPQGPLDGVPVLLKENIATAGTPIPQGTAASELTPASCDAPITTRLATAGAVLLGKTTMPDLGMLTSGLSSFHHLTRNPWNTELTPGGSSAGAAAGAAAGYSPLHVGTDIGGSIRLPAGWCGLVGFKPSFGRIPVTPPYLGRTAGPLTRTVADAALLSEVLAGPDSRDHMSLPHQLIPWTQLQRPLAGLRIGLLMNPGVGLAVDPQVHDAVTAAAERFHQAGAHIEPMSPSLTRHNLDGLDQFWRVRAWSELTAKPPERRNTLLPYIHQWAAAGAELSGLDTYHGFEQIDAISAQTIRACEPFDLVLSPVCPVGPPSADAASPTNDPDSPFEHIAFTLPFNMSGQPAVSINCGYTTHGLPIGLQIAGRRFADLEVLQAAATFETLRGPQRPWPAITSMCTEQGIARGTVRKTV